MQSESRSNQSGGESPREATRQVLGALLRGAVRPVLAIALIALIVMIIDPRVLVTEIEEFREGILLSGVWGILLFIAIYILATVALVPVSVMKMAAGAVFGALWGTIIAVAGLALGAGACLVLTRYVISGPVKRRLEGSPRFHRINLLAQREGAAVVMLARLVPVIPGNLANYMFGMIEVRFGTYVLWTAIGSLPSTIILAVGTDALLQGLQEGRIPWIRLSVVGAAMMFLIVATVISARRIRHDLRELRGARDAKRRER